MYVSKHASRVSLLLGLALAVSLPSEAQTLEGEIAQMANRIEAGREKQLHVIAPSFFARAVERLSRAQTQFERAERIGNIQRSLAEARTNIERAEALEDIGKVLLRDALAARGDAITANAPEFATAAWNDADERMTSAGRKIEEGDQNDARKRAEEAAALYRAAELQAIRQDLLGKAQQARAGAVGLNAPKTAAKTFREADSLLAAAEQQLQENRYDRQGAAAVAREAAVAFQHATRIAQIVMEIDRRKEPAIENLVLSHEADVARIVEQFGFDANFASGLTPVTEQILAAIASLQKDRDNLRDELATKNDELAAKNKELQDTYAKVASLTDSLGGQLAAVQQREREAAERLRERQLREELLRRVQTAFPPADAEVILDGDQVVFHLFALSFPVGSAQITPENYSLLTDLQQVLRDLPAAAIVIEGHTDAQGHAEFNQALSQRRADAIREYLLANMGLRGDQLSAVGFGEARPLATNETPEGRAKNRRIGVRVQLPSIRG